MSEIPKFDVYNELKTYNTNVDVFDPGPTKKKFRKFGIH